MKTSKILDLNNFRLPFFTRISYHALLVLPMQHSMRKQTMTLG